MRPAQLMTIFAVIIGLMGGSLVAETHYIKADGSGDYATIQAAIENASPGDTIKLEAATFTGTGNIGVDFLGKAVVVTGEAGADDTIIDCELLDRGFKFVSTETESSVLHNLTIRNGNALTIGNVGGGILIDSVSPVITGVKIENCTGSGGGGIYISGPTAIPLIQSCEIKDCKATGGSGLSGGGGISVLKAYPLVLDCNIHDNQGANGGGILLTGEGFSEVGGTYSNNQIHHNSATADGGGIKVVAGFSSLVITENLVYANSAANGGGMYFNTISDGAMINTNTVAENTALLGGAGLYFSGAGGIVERTIVAFNSGNAEDAIRCTRSAGIVNCSIIWNPGLIEGSDCGGGNNQTVDPLFYGELGSYNYFLQANSPATAANSPCGELIGALSVYDSDNVPPTISDISDQSTNEDISTEVIAFTVNDTDDDPATLNVSGSSDNTELIPVDGYTFGGSGSNRTVVISPTLNQSGSATVTITVSDGESSTKDTFQLTVNPENDEPTVANEIGDVTVVEDAVSTVINLTNVFTDVDDDDNLITKSVQTNTNSTLVDASILGNFLILDYQLNQSGTANITIRGTSSGQFVDNVFQVAVSADDDAPAVANEIDNIIVTEDVADTVINLSNVFTDIDNDDNLITKSVQSNTNSTLVTASIDGDILTLDFQPNQTGQADITIRGTSNGLLVNDVFIVTVTGDDDAPTVANVIEDVSVAEDAVNTDIDLSAVFTDVDNDDNLITKSLQANTNSTLVSASITDNTLTLDYQADQSGTANITIRGTSNGLFVDDLFQVTVSAEDDAPTVASAIEDVSVDEDAANLEIDLTNVFSDVDDDDNLIYKAVENNSNPELVAASITDNTLTLDYQSDKTGTADITIRGTSNGETVDDTFTVTVQSFNDPPVISDLVDQEFNEDDSLTYTSDQLFDFVSDPDHHDSLLTFLPIGEPNKVYIVLDLPNLILKAPANWFGHDTLQIAVIDPELASDTATVYVEVKSVNDVPFYSELPDLLEMIVETETMLTMSEYVVDHDLPDDHLTWEIASSSDELQLSFNSESTVLTLTALDAPGSYMVYLNVTDYSAASALDSFEVSVTLDPTSIGDLVGDIPTVYSLEQNYPNPFNPTTHIKYGLPEASEVLVEVYNLLGQKVVTLFDGYQAAGYHVLDFEANNLPTGMYFYRIQTKEYQSIKKMLLIK